MRPFVEFVIAQAHSVETGDIHAFVIDQAFEEIEEHRTLKNVAGGEQQNIFVLFTGRFDEMGQAREAADLGRLVIGAYDMAVGVGVSVVSVKHFDQYFVGAQFVVAESGRREKENEKRCQPRRGRKFRRQGEDARPGFNGAIRS
ncbi:MAG: hypothetical protein ACD_47C00416G0001 [uncultured bacterium]|nr:MAG: hypothetical protein ACD_47C00416G0001 [uncultured bacterium]